MALEVYFQADIAAGVVSTTVGMLKSAAAQGFTNTEYARGVVDLAHALALNYRIPWSSLRQQLLDSIDDEHTEILDVLRFSLVIQRSEAPRIPKI
jgi:hypothetical protein